MDRLRSNPSAAIVEYKHVPPASVIVERCAAGERYWLDEILGAIPLSSDTPVTRRHQRPPRRTMSDALLGLPPRFYIEQLTGVHVPREGTIRCPFHHDDTPSLHVYEEPNLAGTASPAGAAVGLPFRSPHLGALHARS